MSDFVEGTLVRREDLRSTSSTWSLPQLETSLQQRLYESLANRYDHMLGETLFNEFQPGARPGIDEPEAEDYAFDFRLFSTASRIGSQGPATTRIIIRSPTPEITEPGFVQSSRPQSYYFAGSPSAAASAEYKQAAVSGQEILENMNNRWRGCELPWRVTKIKVNGFQRSSKGPASITQPEDGLRKKQRSGKKRRIAIRKKAALQVAQGRARAADAMVKEQAEREKKTRRNREKKVKKKEKEKLKKNQAVSTVG